MYGSLLALVISRHEPWFDEAQAWLIARESSLAELFRILPYEGQPGLWHLLLMLPARTLPYEAINWISGLFATLGVWVFLRRSPFPTPLKVLIPFTYFLFYQYGVVARNYALLPLVLFAVAAVWPQRHDRPGRFAALLFVLANTSTHGFIVAGVFLAIFAVEELAEARRSSRRPGRGHVVAVGVTGLALGVVALAMLPPADRTFASDGQQQGDLVDRLAGAAGMLNNALADNLLLLPLILAASVWFFHRRGVLHLWLLPTAALMAFFGLVHRAPWHEGVLFLVWIFAFWVALQREREEDDRGRQVRLAALGALAVVCLFQVSWAVRTAVLDFNNPYSGSEELAAYLKETGVEGKRVFGFHWASFAVNPYFEDNLFENYNPPGKPAYWLWSKRNHMVQDFQLIEALQPDYLIFPVKIPGSEAEAAEALPSYRQKAVFWGSLYWKGRILQPEVYILFERAV